MPAPEGLLLPLQAKLTSTSPAGPQPGEAPSLVTDLELNQHDFYKEERKERGTQGKSWRMWTTRHLAALGRKPWKPCTCARRVRGTPEQPLGNSGCLAAPALEGDEVALCPHCADEQDSPPPTPMSNQGPAGRWSGFQGGGPSRPLKPGAEVLAGGSPQGSWQRRPPGRSGMPAPIPKHMVLQLEHWKYYENTQARRKGRPEAGPWLLSGTRHPSLRHYRVARRCKGTHCRARSFTSGSTAGTDPPAAPTGT